MPSYARACKLYDEGYSLKRLRDRARLEHLHTSHHDLWLSVKVVFKALAHGEEILALPALGGLFDESQCPDLMAADVNLTNDDLLKAMHLMRWADLQGVFTVIDYRNMNTEELGSIYEDMLELVPQVHFKDPSDRFSFSFEFAQGNANERKSTGSYYTPDSLVQSLIKTALDPVIEQKLAEHPEDPEGALLSIKVIDPACGSGHFLLAAARRITERIMQQKAFLEDTEEVEYRKILHKVIANCIYGVDINPMAVELARMGLWLESIAENKPLSFIDHHLKVGNSLLGVMDLNVLKLGIPGDAYKAQKPIGKAQYALTLSDKAVCSTLNKRNTKERKTFAENVSDTGLNSLFGLGSAMQHLGYADLDQFTADTLQAEVFKAQQNARNQEAIEDTVEFKACNLLLSAFLSEKTADTEHLVPTTKDIDLLFTDPEGFELSHKAMLDHANKICAESGVMHWPFAFMEVMDQGGFDCVLGNPPWEKPKVEDVKFFAPLRPDIAFVGKASERKKMINALASSDSKQDRMLFADYVRAQHQASAFSTINHLNAVEGGRFPITGVGDSNLASYFAELVLTIKKESGTAGVVMPVGILLDDATKQFTQKIFSKHLVSSFYHFTNTDRIFRDVDSRYTFALLTLSKSPQTDFVCYATKVEQLSDERRHVVIDQYINALVNPNTKTSFLPQSKNDLNLCIKIYNNNPVFINEYKDCANFWNIKNSRMFDMSNNSGLFASISQYKLDQVDSLGLVPLYEGKFFWQFDHRFSSYCYGEKSTISKRANPQDVDQMSKQDFGFSITPKYWVKASLVQDKWAKLSWSKPWTLAWRDISSATNERTVVAAVMPAKYAFNHKACLLMPDCEDALAACLLALLNSLVVDFVERLKQASTNVCLFYLKQLPVLPPEAFAPADVEFIASRVAKLTRTADDINAVWLTDYPAYTFQEPRERVAIRAELDAYIAKMYGLSREELAYILDPAAVMGPDHPSVTFPGLKRKETELYGEYLTQRLVLQAYDDLTSGVLK